MFLNLVPVSLITAIVKDGWWRVDWSHEDFGKGMVRERVYAGPRPVLHDNNEPKLDPEYTTAAGRTGMWSRDCKWAHTGFARHGGAAEDHVQGDQEMAMSWTKLWHGVCERHEARGFRLCKWITGRTRLKNFKNTLCNVQRWDAGSLHTNWSRTPAQQRVVLVKGGWWPITNHTGECDVNCKIVEHWCLICQYLFGN